MGFLSGLGLVGGWMCAGVWGGWAVGGVGLGWGGWVGSAHSVHGPGTGVRGGF